MVLLYVLEQGKALLRHDVRKLLDILFSRADTKHVVASIHEVIIANSGRLSAFRANPTGVVLVQPVSR